MISYTTSKKLFLLCLMALLLLSLAGCKGDEELPELGCTVDVLIDKDNFNDWEVGIPIESPEYAGGLPRHEGTMLLSEAGTSLSEEQNKLVYKRTKEHVDELKEAWELLETIEEVSEYVKCCAEVGDTSAESFHSVYFADGYVFAYHFLNQVDSDADGNITGAKSVFMIYEAETREVEYLALVEYTKNFIYQTNYDIFPVEDEVEEELEE